MPPLEAVACGTPTISVDDSLSRSEVHSGYCVHMLKPKAWDTWQTGARLCLVDPEDVARQILHVKENYEQAREFTVDAARRVMEDLPWSRTAEFFVDLVRKAYAKAR